MSFLRRLLRKKKKGTPIEYAMRAKPIRNPNLKWEKCSEEKTVILRPPGKSRSRLLLHSAPRKNRIELDKIGAFVWDRCDGQHQVRDIIEELSGRYRLLRQEAQVALFIYLQRLAKRGLIGFVPSSTDQPSESSGLRNVNSRHEK